MRILKYPLTISDIQNLTLPLSAEILSLGKEQNGSIVLYVKVDPDENKTVSHTIHIFGTGFYINPSWKLKFLGTINYADDGVLIFHIFIQE